jgi:hypothetical protein
LRRGNIQPIGFVVGLHLAGQLHDQLRKRPPGTPIEGFKLSGE